MPNIRERWFKKRTDLISAACLAMCTKQCDITKSDAIFCFATLLLGGKSGL